MVYELYAFCPEADITDVNISWRAGLCKGQRKVYKSVLSVTFTNSGDNIFTVRAVMNFKWWLSDW